ncbi:MAG: D-alanyl-D-alanine carboxypeptidase/D-alanyl-D-alanine-endopeptidase [Thiolinea sp.]
MMSLAGMLSSVALSCSLSATAHAEGASTPQPAAELIVREQETQDLPDVLRDYMKKKKIPEEDVGIFVQDVNADAPLVLHEADKAFNPASTMKLVTTWSAVKALRPSWTWDTEAWLHGKLDGDVLHGDLVLKGYGDPFLVYESLWLFVNDLRLKGLREITGDIVIDNSFFDIPEIDPGAFDNHPDRVYNAPPSALMFNFQATRFLFNPDPSHETINVLTQPRLSYTRLDNQLKYIHGRCREQHYNPRIIAQSDGEVRLEGNYADECGPREFVRLLTKPEVHAFNAFRTIWEDLGGTLGGGMRVGTVSKEDQRFHVHTSRELGEQIRLINKWSNNVMTRQLLLTLGARQYGGPATLEKGRMAILDVLREQGVSTDGLVIDNGSGLSRDARISPNQLGQLLQQVWRDPYMPELLNSLPLLGEDGTLYRRFRNSDLKGRSRLKTGTLNRVTAIAGYMLTRSGKRMVIVMLHNGKKAGSHGHALQNSLLEWVFEQ